MLRAGTTERVCLIVGTVEAIIKVASFIQDKIFEKPDPALKLFAGAGTPISEAEFEAAAAAAASAAAAAASTPEHSPSKAGAAAAAAAAGGGASAAAAAAAAAAGGPAQLQQQMLTNRLLLERHKQVKLLVPNSTAGMIIGKGGSFIKELKERTLAFIQISQKPRDVALQERCITIAGARAPPLFPPPPPPRPRFRPSVRHLSSCSENALFQTDSWRAIANAWRPCFLPHSRASSAATRAPRMRMRMRMRLRMICGYWRAA